MTGGDMFGVEEWWRRPHQFSGHEKQLTTLSCRKNDTKGHRAKFQSEQGGLAGKSGGIRVENL